MTGKEACEQLQDAFRKAGMLGNTQYRCEGWKPSNYCDSTCYNLIDCRPGLVHKDKPESDCFAFHILIDGRVSGLSFRKWKEYSESAGVMEMHSPIDEDSLHPRIRSVFTSLGYEVVKIHSSGYSMHWDYDTYYTVFVKPTNLISDTAPAPQRAFARW